MISLWNGYHPENYKYEQDFPMAFPWPEISKEDVPRYVKGADGYWYNPDARNTGRGLLSLTGDLMCEPAQCRVHRYGDSYFFHPAFSYVRNIFKTSDFVVANLETTLTANTPYAGQYHRIAGRYHCNGPECYLDALRYAGFDALVNANNHNCDSGIVGIMDTIEAMDRHGFMHTGSMLDKERALLVKINGIRVGILSYATRYNGLDAYLTEEGIKKYLNPFDEQTAREDVQWARNRGAEFIIAYIHWGIDYDEEPNEEQMTLLPQLGESGVDYIVGSHTHCLQRFDRYTRKDGKVIPLTFSMGNFVTNEKKELCKHTGVLQLTLTKSDGQIQVEEAFIPCYVFDEFGTARYCVVPTDPRFAGTDCEKLHLARGYVRKRIGPNIPEPKTCSISLEELCRVMDVPVPENSTYTTVTHLCTRSGATRPGAVYFARGDEDRQEQLLVIKNLVAAVISPVQWQGGEAIVYSDVSGAYRKACACLRPNIQTKLIAVTGKQGKTLTRQLLCHALRSKYSVLTHEDKYHGDTGIWQDAIEYNDYCVFELQNDEPMDNLLQAIKPDYILCTDDFMNDYQSADDVKLPFSWQKKCVGGVLEFIEAFGITDPFRGFTYESNTCNIKVCGGVTVVFDLACTDPSPLLETAAKLPGRLLVMGYDLPPVQAAFQWDAKAMTLRERETALMEHLREGDVLVLCCDRQGDLDVTLRRLFGISDGYIRGGR